MDPSFIYFIPQFVPNEALPFDLKITPYNSGQQSRIKDDMDGLYCGETLIRPNIIKMDSHEQDHPQSFLPGQENSLLSIKNGRDLN